MDLFKNALALLGGAGVVLAVLRWLGDKWIAVRLEQGIKHEYEAIAQRVQHQHDTKLAAQKAEHDAQIVPQKAVFDAQLATMKALD